MLRKILTGLFCLFLSGCLNQNKNKEQNKLIILTALNGMNNGAALSIDVVQVYEEYIWRELVLLSAKEYFARRDTIIQKKVATWIIHVLEKECWGKCFGLKGYQENCIGVILFANYQSDDPNTKNRVILKNDSDCTCIRLGINSIEEAYSANFPVTEYESVAQISS